MKSTTLILVFCTVTAFAQTLEKQFETHPFLYNSGLIENESGLRTLVYEDVVELPGASSIRLNFSDIQLGEVPESGIPTILRITSLKDGAVQLLNAVSLLQWRNSSAYFNGDAVRIEIIADAEAGPSFLNMSEIQIGVPPTFPESICGPTDDRVLSSDPRAARLVPVGCTGWLFNDENTCFLSAGHCDNGTMDVAEFNVPLSNPDGSINHPPPSDQYPIDAQSVQTQNGDTSIGNDFAYFGTFPNSNTGLTPFEAQGDRYMLGTVPTSANNETIRITGYGVNNDASLGNPLTFNQVQTTHTGDLVLADPVTFRLSYTPDTTGGNSGSAVYDETTGTAIGIHTNAGCSATGGANNGMSLLNPDLQAVLASPLGVCAPPPQFTLSNIGSLIYDVNTSYVLNLDIVPVDKAPVTVANLSYRVNDATDFTLVGLENTSGNTYSHTFENLVCGDRVEFFIEIQGDNGFSLFSPQFGPNQTHLLILGDSEAIVFEDTFATDQGWTVESGAGLTDGEWERSEIPAGASRGAMPFDIDGDGWVFQTDAALGNSDVDGDTTTLVSPVLDPTPLEDAYLRFWFSYSTDLSATIDDVFTIEMTNDGLNWVPVETVGPTSTAGWNYRNLRIANFVDLTTQVQIRFVATDGGEASIVEAAVDAFSLYDAQAFARCVLPCPLDLNDDGLINSADLDVSHDAWDMRHSDYDLNEDGFHDIRDTIHLMENLDQECP
jgi:hypothetical protein